MQISGAWSAEVPTGRLARLVAAEVIEYIGRPDVLDAIGAAIAGRMVDQQVSTAPQADPGGRPLGGRHQGAGDPFYDREPEGGDQ